MSYGITSSSQLIDIGTIKSGCNQLVSEFDAFDSCGNKVIEASETCDKKALSVDDKTMEYSISDVGTAISNLKSEYSQYVDDVLEEAISVYNAQVNELNAYIQAQQNKENSN